MFSSSTGSNVQRNYPLLPVCLQLSTSTAESLCLRSGMLIGGAIEVLAPPRLLLTCDSSPLKDVSASSSGIVGAYVSAFRASSSGRVSIPVPADLSRRALPLPAVIGVFYQVHETGLRAAILFTAVLNTVSPHPNFGERPTPLTVRAILFAIIVCWASECSVLLVEAQMADV